MPETYFFYDGSEYTGRNLHGELADAQAEATALGFTLGSAPTLTAAQALAVERAGMVVSRMQARLALHNANLLAGVEAAVAAADPAVQIAWADAVEFQRNSPTIAALQAAVSLTDTQIDDLFRAAALITA